MLVRLVGLQEHILPDLGLLDRTVWWGLRLCTAAVILIVSVKSVLLVLGWDIH